MTVKASHATSATVADFSAVYGAEHLAGRHLTGTLHLAQCQCDGEHCSEATGCGADVIVELDLAEVTGVDQWNTVLIGAETGVPGYANAAGQLTVDAQELYGLDVDVTYDERDYIERAVRGSAF